MTEVACYLHGYCYIGCHRQATVLPWIGVEEMGSWDTLLHIINRIIRRHRRLLNEATHTCHTLLQQSAAFMAMAVLMFPECTLVFQIYMSLSFFFPARPQE